MATEKDLALIDFLVEKTDSGEIRWEPTADTDQFTTSFKGKYNVTVDKGAGGDQVSYWVTLKDENGRELLVVYQWEHELIKNLFYLARRRSLNVDTAIDEIMGGSRKDDEDIPF